MIFLVFLEVVVQIVHGYLMQTIVINHGLGAVSEKRAVVKSMSVSAL